MSSSGTLLAHHPRKCKRFGDAQVSDGGLKRQCAMDVLMRRALAVRAAGAAGLGTSPQRLVDDGLDGARASAAFGAAAEAAVDLLGVAGKVLR